MVRRRRKPHGIVVESDGSVVESVKRYYHITAVESVKPIMRKGLKGGKNPRNRGETLPFPCVFALVTKDNRVTDHVVINQLWPYEDVAEYAIIGIDPAGITGPILVDGVAERTAPLHRVIRQDVIHPKYLELAQRRRIDYPGRRVLEVNNKILREKLEPADWEIVARWLGDREVLIQKLYEAQWQGGSRP